MQYSTHKHAYQVNLTQYEHRLWSKPGNVYVNCGKSTARSKPKQSVRRNNARHHCVTYLALFHIIHDDLSRALSANALSEPRGNYYRRFNTTHVASSQQISVGGERDSTYRPFVRALEQSQQCEGPIRIPTIQVHLCILYESFSSYVRFSKLFWICHDPVNGKPNGVNGTSPHRWTQLTPMFESKKKPHLSTNNNDPCTYVHTDRTVLSIHDTDTLP